MIKETLQQSYIEIELILAQLEMQFSELTDTMIIETKRKIVQGYSKQQAITMIMGDFNSGKNFMNTWVNKQDRMIKLAYKNVIQNTNKSIIKKDEKVRWVIESGAEHCEDCLMMNGQVGTMSELRAFGVGLPGDGLTKCNVGCACMLEKVASEQIIEQPIKQIKATNKMNWKNDAVASQMKTEENAIKYMDYKAKYDKELSKFAGEKIEVQGKAVADIIKSDKSLDNFRETLKIWKTDNNTMEGKSFQYIAHKVEKNIKYYVEAIPKNLEQIQSFISVDEYLKMRAINQSYCDLTKLKNIKLYRGTDGDIGKKMAQTVNNLKKKGIKQITIEDRGVSCYTSRADASYDFGVNRGGISIKTDVNSTDIIIHNDILSNLAPKWNIEEEWILKGYQKKYNLKNIHTKSIDLKLLWRGQRGLWY